MNKGMIKAAAALTAAAVFLSYSPETVSERALARPAVKSEFSVPLPVFKTVTGAADAMEPVLVYGTEDTAETEPEAYPSEYDMRAEYPVTAVRNQSGYGTCWAHSSIASAETGLGERIPGADLSEFHTAYFAYSGGDQIENGGAAPKQIMSNGANII